MAFLKDVRVVGGLWLLVRLFLGYEWLKGGIAKLGDPAWVGGEAGAAVGGFLEGGLAKAAGELAGLLAEAGFEHLRTEMLDLDPPAACVLGHVAAADDADVS